MLFCHAHSVRGLWTWNHHLLCSFQLSIYNAEIIQLQFALDDEYNNFSGNSKPVPHFKANSWKTFSKNYSRTFTSEQFHSALQETLQHFARFWRLFLSVMWSIIFPIFLSRFLFSRSFLIFMVTSDWVLNQVRIRIAYNSKFQWKRNELLHPAEKILLQ